MSDPQVHLLQLALPAFGDIDAVTWFAVFDIEMSNRNVTLDEVKFGQQIPRLPREVLPLITELLLSTDFKTRYETPKSIILASQQPSDSTRLDKLLHTLQLVNRKPSALLREMQDLTGSRCDAVTIRKIWMQRLLSSVQDILASKPGSSLKTAVAVTDAGCDSRRPLMLCATFLSVPPSAPATSNDRELQALKELLREEIAKNAETISKIADLWRNLAELRLHRSRPRQLASLCRCRSPQRPSRSLFRDTDPALCHHEFRDAHASADPRAVSINPRGKLRPTCFRDERVRLIAQAYVSPP